MFELELENVTFVKIQNMPQEMKTILVIINSKGFLCNNDCWTLRCETILEIRRVDKEKEHYIEEYFVI